MVVSKSCKGQQRQRRRECQEKASSSQVTKSNPKTKSRSKPITITISDSDNNNSVACNSSIECLSMDPNSSQPDHFTFDNNDVGNLDTTARHIAVDLTE
jgi:hypothetical protein